jgi:peptidoglycan LD-endopeptidase LytH
MIAASKPNATSDRRSVWRKLLWASMGLFVCGFLIPERARIPVEGATRKDWNPQSFWYEPWGASGVHKGIDIFAPQGRPVRAATPGIALYKGVFGNGGKVCVVLGPKWRLHYYAHLSRQGETGWLVTRDELLGAVGTTGNAAGKAPHLHYSVLSLVPLPWRYRSATQGWKRMFFLDPGDLIVEVR